jgi:4'-phosphopantetheinyl transferase
LAIGSGWGASRTDSIVWLLDRRQISPAVLVAADARLAEAERVQQSHFNASRREQGVLGHVLLQYALAREIGCDPGAIRVSARAANRPRINAPGGELPRFSLSHSGPWVACAVHATTEIGLDVEIVNSTRDFIAISAWLFGPEEHDWLLRQPDRAGAFYRLWTGKEALVKLSHQIGRPSALHELRFAIEGDSVGAPPPAKRWHHEQTSSGLALSLMSVAPAGLVRIQPIDGPSFSALFESATSGRNSRK